MSRVVRKETQHIHISLGQKLDLEILILLVLIETACVELLSSFDFKSR